MKEELSTCEAPIMKIIWESDPDISIPALTEQLNVQYGKEYARTTVVTFLIRLAGKGYVSTYRKGRLSYAHAEKSEQEYRQMLAKNQMEFWFNGNVCEFIQALCEVSPLTEEETENAKMMLDRMEKAQEK